MKINKYTLNLGAEIHLRVLSERKLFCHCVNDGTATCVICLGQPGTLPFFEESIIQKIYKFIGVFLEEKEETVQLEFIRKNYVYPDLPKKFQITQLNNALLNHGRIHIPIFDKKAIYQRHKDVRILRIAVEADAAKNLGNVDEDEFFLNFGRAESPLIEITTDHRDIQTSEELMSLLRIIRFYAFSFGVSDISMETGAFRSDINLSLTLSIEDGKVVQTPRIELKNINSIKHIMNAIDFEEERLLKLVDKASCLEEIEQFIPSETRGWKEEKNCSFAMRKKQTSYFFLKEFDLPNINIKWCQNNETELWIEKHCSNSLKNNIELPKDYVMLLHEFPFKNGFSELSYFLDCLSNADVAFTRVLLYYIQYFVKLVNKEKSCITHLASLIVKLDKLLLLNKIDQQELRKFLNNFLISFVEDISMLSEFEHRQYITENDLRILIKEVCATCNTLVLDYVNGDNDKRMKLQNIFIGKIVTSLKSRRLTNSMEMIQKILGEELVGFIAQR